MALKQIIVVLALFIAYTAAVPSCTAYCRAIFNSSFTANCGTAPDFASEANCNSWCSVANQTLGTDADTAGNTLGCRIYHAGVAASQSAYTAHCDHASIMGGDTCGTRCESYCQNAMYGPCRGSFPSMSVCMTVCASYPTTFPSGNNGTDITANDPSHWANNVQCRHYHAAFPSLTPNENVHCAHGWPTGGNACQDGNDICAGYCQLYIAVCNTTNLRESGVSSLASCKTACQGRSSLAILGNSNWVGNGSTGGQPVGDNLDCRVYHLIAAVTDANTHCPHAWVAATTGPCAAAASTTATTASSPTPTPTPTPTPVGPTPSPTSTTGASGIVAPVAIIVGLLFALISIM